MLQLVFQIPNKIKLKKIIKNVIVNDLPKKMIVTPKVVNAARKHFGCNNLEGVELEDQGGEGTKNSHWESRVMLGDFMIGESYGDNVISEITLALFEDSGWYKVNYYTGGLFRYGKNKGCDFVQKKCINSEKSSFPNEFCTTPDAPMCFGSNLSRGICNLSKINGTIPLPYSYFSNETLGGYELADYCPIAKYIDDKKDMFFSSSCAIGHLNYPDLGEDIGINSGCFMSSLVQKSNKNYDSLKENKRAICHYYKCNSADQSYTVTILDKTISCNKEGEAKSVEGFEGTFICTDFNSICTKDTPCKDAIDCAVKKVAYKQGNTIFSNNIVTPSNGSGDSSQIYTNAEYLSFTYLYLLLIILIFGNN